MSRYLGIDFGTKRVGLAVSDPTRLIAQGVTTLTYHSQKHLITQLRKFVDEHEIVKIIVGLPLSMSGKDSQKTVEVREFAETLRGKFTQPVEFMDERLTTVMAHQTMHLMGKKPGRNKEKVDLLAAQNILQIYLDKEKGLRQL
ncbi:MAG: Holliday junction resolvase RuvX [Calditrichia bacterium]